MPTTIEKLKAETIVARTEVEAMTESEVNADMDARNINRHALTFVLKKRFLVDAIVTERVLGNE